MHLKGILVTIVILHLSGCASYIAKKVTSMPDNQVTGNVTAMAKQITLCDSPENCVSVYLTGRTQGPSLKISSTFPWKNAPIWQFTSDTANVALANDLIVIFSGYGQNWQTLFIHQLWLQHITGAVVMVVPSANHSNNFQFGLNYVAPVVAEIKRRSPSKVHIVGFSMGAIAAQRVAEQLNNVQLHLIAPLTNFFDSADSIWQMEEQNNWLLKLVSQSTLNRVKSGVMKKAGVSINDISILSSANTTPMFVYISDEDKVTRAVDWENHKQTDTRFFSYQDLTHIQMIALARPQLMKDFVSNILWAAKSSTKGLQHLGSKLREQELEQLIGSFSCGDKKECALKQ